MSKSKTTGSWRAAVGKRVLRALPRSIVGWAVLFAATAGTVGFGAKWVWALVRYHVELQPEYLVDPRHNIELSPAQPVWIKNDLKAAVIRDARLAPPLSLLDDQLTSRVAQAFALNPWIANVRGIERIYPRHLRVEVSYRKPVAMVEVTGGLLPVDENATLLPPSEFSPDEAGSYLRISGITSSPLGPVGTPWGDPMVEIEAAVASRLDNVKMEYKLHGICGKLISSPQGADQLQIQLLTKEKTAFTWSVAAAPQLEDPALAAAKLKQLAKLSKQFGSLDKIPAKLRDLTQSTE